jgi:hypothetical protein
MAGAGNPRNERTVTIVVAMIYLGLLALDVWLLILVPSASWEEKISLLLQVVGLFAIATGFVAATELSKGFATLLEEMTSPNLRDFLYGNLKLGTVVQSVMVELYRGLLSSSGWYAGLHFALLWLLALPIILMLLAAFYVFVVPVAYIAYVAASVPLLTIRDAQDTVTVRAGDEKVDARDLVVRHMVPLRSFLVGLTATLFSLVTRVLALY